MVVAMFGHGVQAVDAFGGILRDMLGRAKSVKQTITVEPPLNKSDIIDLSAQLDPTFPSASSQELKKRIQYAIVETAVRDTFNNLLVSRLPVQS